jgi:hypothetical protein
MMKAGWAPIVEVRYRCNTCGRVTCNDNKLPLFNHEDCRYCGGDAVYEGEARVGAKVTWVIHPV